jgi:hypothetical protein
MILVLSREKDERNYEKKLSVWKKVKEREIPEAFFYKCIVWHHLGQVRARKLYTSQPQARTLAVIASFYVISTLFFSTDIISGA